MSPLSPIQATFTADESCQVLAALHTAHGWDELVLTVPGEFQVVNQHLLKDLTELGIWGEEMKHKLIAHHGSVQVRVHCPSLWPHLSLPLSSAEYQGNSSRAEATVQDSMGDVSTCSD